MSGLMRVAIAGNANAYEQLLGLLAPLLRAAAQQGFRRAGINDDDAEDVVQETLLAIHLKRHTWDPERPLGPWLRAIVHNKLVDNIRRRSKLPNIPLEGLEDFLPLEETNPPVEVRDVEPYFNAMPARQQSVLRAILQEEKSISETAKQLGISEGAVRVALHRGLAGLAGRFRRDTE